MTHAVEAAIHGVDPTLPVYGERTLETSISTAYFSQRMGGSLLGRVARGWADQEDPKDASP
jgi:hypothetical protein